MPPPDRPLRRLPLPRRRRRAAWALLLLLPAAEAAAAPHAADRPGDVPVEKPAEKKGAEKPGPAGVANPDRRLKELENALKKGEGERQQIVRKAEALSKDLAELRGEMVNAARLVQEHEENLSELELQLRELGTVEGDKMRELDLKRQQMNGVLTALQRLAFRPSEALIAQPTSPADTVRSAILLRDVLPRLNQATGELKGELDGLAHLRDDISRQKQKIAKVSDRLDQEHRRLAALYDRKEKIQEDAEAQRRDTEKRLSDMASEASDLRELMAKLEEDRRRREQEAVEKAAAEKAAREAEKQAARAAAQAAREAEAAARQAAHEAELAQQKAEKERREAEQVAARQARQAEEEARRTAREAEAAAARAADKAAHEAAEAEARAVAQEAATPHASFSGAQGQMPLPARGRVVTKFGQAGEGGSPSKGISIETRAGGQVIAPFDGQVVFAGPFRGYGLLLIIEHGEGYHTLLAGMSRIDGTVGQHLLTGEPVGVMGPSEERPLLYVELRHNGQPVNPLPWLTARKTKVTG